MNFIHSLYVDKEIEKVLTRFPERFTEEEKEYLRSDYCEVRQCSECGNFMNAGWTFPDAGDGKPYYCSEECLRKDGISQRDMTLYYYGFAPGDVADDIEGLTDEEVDKWAMENGSEDDSIGFYTEWEAPLELVEKLNKCRREL